MSILSVQGLTKSYGGLKAVDNFSMEVPFGSIYGLIGPNGAGKTTAFNCISRFTEPDCGSLIFRPNPAAKPEEKSPEINLLACKVHQVIGHGLSRTFQHAEVFWSLSVIENILVGEHCRTREGFFSQGLALPSIRREEKRLREKAQAVMEYLGIAHLADLPAIAQPYGTQKLIELARAVISSPRLLILDEPAAGMDQTETEDLAEMIRGIRTHYDTTILMVEHDMSLVMEVCDHISVINFGRNLAQGSPEQIKANPLVQEAYLGQEGGQDAPLSV